MNPRTWGVSALALSLFIGGLLAFPSTRAESANGSNPPLGIHLSYLDEPTQATITWHTALAATSRAEWGLSPGPPYPNAATGVDYVSPGGTFLHIVTLTGLAPGARYYYRVGDIGMSSWFGESTFRAAIPGGSTATFSFAAVGDWGYNPAAIATANAIARRNPNLVLGLGDYYYSSSETVVRSVFEAWEAYGTGSFHQLGMGNHEQGSGADPFHTLKETHCAFVNQEGNERSFAFTYGHTFFMTIDWGRSAADQTDGADAAGPSCEGTPGNPAIRQWADAQLAAADLDPEVVWKVVYMHYPCYDPTFQPWEVNVCSQGGSPDQFEDILVNRNVDLVLTGHRHSYGRTHPVKFNAVAQVGSTYDTPGAPIHFVIGTGGQSPSPAPCRQDSWIAVCIGPVPNGGFGHFTVSSTTFRYEFLDNSAGVLDGFTLHKTPTTTFHASVDPGFAIMGRNATRTATVSVRGVSPNPVTLSVSGCPSGATCTLTPSSGNPTFSSTLQITTGSSVVDGSYPLTITATNGAVTRILQFSLEVATRFTFSFQRGDGGSLSETDDTYVGNGEPATNYGTMKSLFVDGEGCIDDLDPTHLCRALIKFPNVFGSSPGQIPLDSTIIGANLDLYVESTGAQSSVYRIMEPWSEATASWNSFATPGFPNNNGVEFTFLPFKIGRMTLDVTSIVASWAAGSSNEGVFISMTGWDGALFGSSESSERPKLTVTFEPPIQLFDFSLGVSPASATTQSGQSVTTSVTATLLSGSPQSVSFSASGLPPGTSASFSPGSCSPTCTTTMTVSTSSDTPDGTSTITVTGSGGGIDRTGTFTLMIVNQITRSFAEGDGGAYSTTHDAYIYSGLPLNNYGNDPYLYVDTLTILPPSGCILVVTDCRSLVKFPNFIGSNSGQVPAGAQIVSASLDFQITDNGGTQYAYQITESWSESTVTWLSFVPPGAPSTKGNPVTFAAPKGTVTVDVKAFVQNWVNGDANQGLFLTSPSSDGVDYQSSESSGPPKLTVTFNPPDGFSSDPPLSSHEHAMSAGQGPDEVHERSPPANGIVPADGLIVPSAMTVRPPRRIE